MLIHSLEAITLAHWYSLEDNEDEGLSKKAVREEGMITSENWAMATVRLLNGVDFLSKSLQNTSKLYK